MCAYNSYSAKHNSVNIERIRHEIESSNLDILWSYHNVSTMSSDDEGVSVSEHRDSEQQTIDKYLQVSKVWNTR